MTRSCSARRAVLLCRLAAGLAVAGCSAPSPPRDGGRDAGGGTDAPVRLDAPPGADVPPGVDVPPPPIDAPPGTDAPPPPIDAPPGADVPTATDGGTPGSACPPLPAPGGTVVRVTRAMAPMLASIVAAAASGTTIMLEDGTYDLTGAGLRFQTAGITLRSASNDASAVVLDARYTVNEAVNINASDVTIAHVTITRAVDHLIHVTPGSGGDVTNARMYGLRLIDGGEQFIKGNANGARTAWVDRGRVECSFFQMTAAGRPRIERLGGTSCYTGGIDVHTSRSWVVRANRFEGIYCDDGQTAEHAVHFWQGARDTLVENNVVVDCSRGIGLGLGAEGGPRTYPDNPYPGITAVGHYDGIIRNNVVWATIRQFDTGIELNQARGVRVYHNTVVNRPPAGALFFSSIDYRFANTVADIRNNLTRRITLRDGAMGMVASNLEMAPESLFANVGALDFHLAAGATGAIDRGVAVPEAGLDMDGEPHTRGMPDLGADER